MKRALALLSAFSAPAEAHESFVPQVHPHGLSMLVSGSAFICMLLALIVALMAYLRFVRVP